MKVNICTTVDVETTADVSVEDITTALCECADEMWKCGECYGVVSPQTLNAAKRLIAAAWQCLLAVPDEVIAEFSDADRKMIAGRLSEQRDRMAGNCY